MKNTTYDKIQTGPVGPSIRNPGCCGCAVPGEGGDQQGGGMKESECGMMPYALRMLMENGIETTELEAAFDNGDMNAVHVFFQKIRPTGAGTGNYHRDVSTKPVPRDSFVK